MLKFFRIPFATTGDKTAVPDPVDSNGNVSYSQGYGFDYQRQKTDPAAKNIERDKMNQIFFDMTTAVSELQSLGVPDFITTALNGGTAYSYSQNAMVRYSGDLYLSLADSNTALPSDATKWALLTTPARLQAAFNSSAVAGGTANAITATFVPAITALPAAPGTLSLYVRAGAANTTTTPTLKVGSPAAKIIVKGNNLPLAVGDIAGAGHWLELQYDATLDRWVLQNPATGVVPGVTAADLQNQTYTAFTTGGVSGAFTLTPSPALSAYAAGQRFRVRFSASGNGSDTLNVSGLGAKNILQRTAVGGTTPANIYSGALFDLEYDGTRFFVLNPPPPLPEAVRGAFSKLAASATGTGANISVSAEEISVERNATGEYKTLRGVSLTVAGTAVGPNGLDAGVLAANTWYSLWVIYDPIAATVAGLLSTSLSPTLPSGYLYQARIGWIRTDGTANKYPLGFTQYGRRVQYRISTGLNLTAAPVMASGVAGTIGTTLVSVGISNFVPSTAAVLFGTGTAVGPASFTVGPNSFATYGGSVRGASAPSGTTSLPDFNFVLESPTAIYWNSDGASNKISCVGWEDQL